MCRFLDLVESGHGTIAPHVRRISLPLYEANETSDEHRLPDGMRPALTRIFVRVLLPLSRLRSIIIYGISTSRVEGEVVANALLSLTQLRSLELGNLILDSFAVLQEIVASCSGLQNLYVYRLSEKSERTNPPPPPRPPRPSPSLKLLSIVDCTFIVRLLAWIGEGEQVSQPGFICVGTNDAYKHQRRFGSFLRNMGPALKALCINENPNARGDTPPGEIPAFIHLNHVFPH